MPVTQLASSLDLNIQSKDNSSEAIQKSEAKKIEALDSRADTSVEKADPDKIMETVMGLINEKPAQIRFRGPFANNEIENMTTGT